jgi:hypothetical protein
VFREKAGKELTNDQLKALLTEGRTGIIKGFKSKQGNSFDAVVTLNRETFQTEFSFPERKKSARKVNPENNAVPLPLTFIFIHRLHDF